MGWYDSNVVRVGQGFQVDSKSDIKWDYRGDIKDRISLKLSDRLRKSYYESGTVKGG